MEKAQRRWCELGMRMFCFSAQSWAGTSWRYLDFALRSCVASDVVLIREMKYAVEGFVVMFRSRIV